LVSSDYVNFCQVKSGYAMLGQGRYGWAGYNRLSQVTLGYDRLG